MNFLGLGFEVGQEKNGLRHSPQHMRGYFSLLEKFGLKMVDQGDISSALGNSAKVYSSAHLEKVDWNPYKQAYKKIGGFLRQPETLINWGGDHSVALSTVGSFCFRYPTGYVLWIDAHADLNLPRYSPSGNLHGMPLSILMNLQNVRSKYFPWIKQGLDPQKLIYLGIRDLDPFEKEMIQGLNIKNFSSEAVRRRGMRAIAREIKQWIQGHPLHISFDIDSVSAELAPATGVPVAHGLTTEDLQILGQILSEHQNICSLDMVEINPDLGKEKEVSQTYLAALNFLMALFYQGGINDGISRSNQTLDPVSLESLSQI